MQEEHRAADPGGVVPQEDVVLRREQGRDEDAQPRRQAGMTSKLILGHLHEFLKTCESSI